MTHREITKEIWEDANNQWVVVTIWTAKPGRKRQTPTVKVAGDYPTYAKAMAVKKKMERATDPYYSPDRRTIYVARKFDVSKLNIFDSFSYPYEPNEPKEKPMLVGSPEHDKFCADECLKRALKDEADRIADEQDRIANGD